MCRPSVNRVNRLRPPINMCKCYREIVCRGKLGNGEHLSLEAYKYKENDTYNLITQHKLHIKFLPRNTFLST